MVPGFRGYGWDVPEKEIIERCKNFDTLSEDFLAKGLAEGNIALDPSTDIEYEDRDHTGAARATVKGRYETIISDHIGTALSNIHPNKSSECIENTIRNTFSITCMHDVLADATDQDPIELHKEFYSKMSSRFVYVTHREEKTSYPRCHPKVQRAKEYLFDENSNAGEIPKKVRSRYKRDWRVAKIHAKEWGEDWDIGPLRAFKLLVPALMAVEVHTGGSEEKAGPYRLYLESVGEKLVRDFQEEFDLPGQEISNIFEESGWDTDLEFH